MTEQRRFILPEARGWGMTSGDTWWRGLQSHDDWGEAVDRRNGLPIDTRTTDDVPAWRERVAKAKEDIRQHQRDCQLTEVSKLALFCSDDVADLILIARGEKTCEQCYFKN